MHCDPPAAPSMASLAAVLPAYGEFPFDRTLQTARDDIGDRPDLASPAHARRLRVWLNQWLCRIGYPAADDDVFAESLAAWWRDWQGLLPPAGTGLADLSDADLQDVSRSYAGLRRLPAAVSRTGRVRSVGPTAAAKLLYFVRPAAVTAWDRQISGRTGGGQDQSAFLRHLIVCQSWAAGLEAEGRAIGLKAEEIGPHLGRPKSSVAKLIDEWLYATITVGLSPWGIRSADRCEP